MGICYLYEILFWKVNTWWNVSKKIPKGRKKPCTWETKSWNRNRNRNRSSKHDIGLFQRKKVRKRQEWGSLRLHSPHADLEEKINMSMWESDTVAIARHAPWTPPPTPTSPILLPFPSLFLLIFPSISLSLSSSVPHFKYTPSVLIHYPSFSFKILSHLQLPTITIAQEMALNSFRAFLSIFSLLFTIVAAEDPYRFFTWNVTFGDIYPLGIRQQVCYLNLLLFLRKNQLDWWYIYLDSVDLVPDSHQNQQVHGWSIVGNLDQWPIPRSWYLLRYQR